MIKRLAKIRILGRRRVNILKNEQSPLRSAPPNMGMTLLMPFQSVVTTVKNGTRLGELSMYAEGLKMQSTRSV
jgi:hypothetical protein